MKTIKNKYKIVDDYVIIYIEHKKHGTLEAYVDIEDLDLLLNFDCSWHSSYIKSTDTFYCRCSLYPRDENGKRHLKLLYLHQFLLDTYGKDILIDHADGNGLNNRRKNLRATEMKFNSKNRNKLNSNNSSGYRNVSHDSRGNPIVQLQDENGKNHIWRDFESFEEAGAFAAKMRQEWYGEFSGI